MPTYPNPPQGSAGGSGTFAYFAGAFARGYQSIAYGAYALALGHIARAKGRYSIVLGYRAKDGCAEDGAGSSIVIGGEAETTSDDPTTQAVDGCNIAIGGEAKARAWRAIAIGFKAQALAISATAVGTFARALHTHVFVGGRGAFSVVAGSVVLGTSGDGTFYVHFNNNHSAAYMENGDVVRRDPLLCPTVLRGMSGVDRTATPIPDIPGSDFLTGGGLSTGTAQGGAYRIQVAAPTAESGTAENTAVDALTVERDGLVKVFTRLAIPGDDGNYYRIFVNAAGCLDRELIPPPEPPP